MVIFLIVSRTNQKKTHRIFQFLVDISIYKYGFHSDLNETFLIGNVDQKTRDLVRTSYECLEKAMEMSE
jgi:methionine aminopeptidase